MSVGWRLTPGALDRLLLALHPDRDRAAEEYENLRRKVGKLLEWRGCLTPDEGADRVLDRLARRIEAGEEVGNLYSYCCGIARLLLLEDQRQAEKERELRQFFVPAAPDPWEPAIPLEAFERCLRRLPEVSRELVLAYYQDEKQAKIDHRKALADRLGMPLNALRLRVHRIRTRLRNCVERNAAKISGTPQREDLEAHEQ